MPKDVTDTDDYRGARFTRVDLSGVRMRDVNLSGAKIGDALLVNAQLSGDITGLRVNDVDVAPLVEAELDRRHPERIALRASTPAGLRDGWATVAAFWQPTLAWARGLPEPMCHERVDDEWSLAETLRHLVFVTDAWFGRAVLGRSRPYHPLGLPPTFLGDLSHLGIDVAATPSLAEVLSVRAGRGDEVHEFLAAVTDDELAAPRRSNDAAGYPPPTDHSVRACLHVVMDEEWCHHKYAVRDLTVLTASRAASARSAPDRDPAAPPA